MAYNGTTSTSPNPPVLVAGGGLYYMPSTLGSQQSAIGRLWYYNSTHVSADITGAGFITDGQKLGIKIWDRLIHFSSASDMAMYVCNGVTATGAEFGTASTWSVLTG